MRIRSVLRAVATSDPFVACVGCLFLAVIVAEVAVGTHVRLGILRFRWAEFIVIGLASPAVLLLSPRIPSKTRVATGLVLCGGAFVWAIAFAIVAHRIDSIFVAVSTCFIIWLSRGFDAQHFSKILGYVTAVTLGSVTICATAAVYGMAPSSLLSTEPASVLVFIVLAIIIGGAIATSAPSTIKPRAISAAGIALAAFVLIDTAFRQFPVLNAGELHHISFWAGPAELVRHGAWLLWDAPSQYGYLNILTIADMPTASVWDAVKFTASLLICLSAALYLTISLMRRRDTLGFIAALLVSVAIVVLAPGNFDNNNFTYPMSGPLRFFWPYVIITVIAGLYSCKSHRRRNALVFCGTLSWIIGIFWSAESAIYVSCTWLPALVGFQYVWAIERGAGQRAQIAGAVNAICVSLAVLTTAFLCINAIYLLQLHHLPDWYAFVEFGFLYSNGAGSNPVNPVGGVWLLLLAGSMVIASGALLIRRQRWNALPLIAGCFGGMWSTSSYFVMRSVDSNVIVLLPMIAFVFAALLLTIERESLETDAAAIRYTGISILVWASVITLSNFTGLHLIEWPFFSPNYQATILPSIGATTTAEYPGQMTVDPALLRLRQSVGALSTDRYLLYSAPPAAAIQIAGGDNFIEPLPFLPAAPESMFEQLSPARIAQYVERYDALQAQEGWIISPAAIPCTHYIPGSITRIEKTVPGWRIAYCTNPRAKAPAFARPRPLSDTSNELFGSLDEIYFGNAPSFTTDSAPVLAKRGDPFSIRGWLVKSDSRPLPGPIVAVVDFNDATRIAAAYGDPRPEIPAYMSTRHPGTYTANSGFHVSIPTKALLPGLHRLQFEVLTPDGTVLLEPALQFGIL